MPVTRKQKWKRYKGRWLKKCPKLKREKPKLMMSWRKYRYLLRLIILSSVIHYKVNLYCFPLYHVLFLSSSLWWMKQSVLLETSSQKLCLRSALCVCLLMSSETSWRGYWDWWEYLTPPGSAWRGERDMGQNTWEHCQHWWFARINRKKKAQ